MSDTTSTTEPRKPRGRQKQMTKGADLLPDASLLQAVSEREYFYWVGVLPACPIESLAIGGIRFPKVQAQVRKDAASGKGQHYPYIGAITRLTRARLKKIEERMRWSVIRFTSAPHPEEPRAGTTMEDNRRPSKAELAALKEAGEPIPLGHYRRKGYPIRIPTPEEIQLAADNNRGLPRYVAGEHDEPAARYVFMQLCENQDRPQPGEVYPDAVEVTGIEWPE